MKKRVFNTFLTFALLCNFTLISTFSIAETEVDASSKIEKVNVFVNRAQVMRTAKTSIQPGITNITLSGLTTKIDVNSIQVEGTGNFVLMSVKYQTDYLNKNASSQKTRKIQDQIDALTLTNKKLTGKNQVLMEEKQLLLSNQSISSQKTGVTALELQNNATFFRNRRTDIDKLYIENEQKWKENNKKITDLQNQLNEINRNQNTASGTIVVSVASKTAQTIALDFDYIVYSAGWTPYYDIRAEEGNENVQLNYKAQIKQYTGVDWNDVLISVSTGNPAQGGNKPNLNPWYITAQEPVIYQTESKPKGNRRGYGAPAAAKEDAYEESVAYSEDDGFGDADVVENSADYTTVTESDLAVTFDIALKQTIPSDNKEYTVDIRDFDVAAKYMHAAVPKLDLDAFLVANLTGYEELNLLSGGGNVFYDGAYVGKTYLNLKNTTDSLEVSLGRDQKVVITRDKIKNYCKTRTIGTNVKRSIGYEINVRNTKKQKIKLVLEDHVPISNTSQAEVSINELSGGKLDEKTKKITWKLELEPGESKKLELKFEVKYPKKYTSVNL